MESIWPLVGCNPTFAKNGRSGASPIPGFVLNSYVIVGNTGICYVAVGCIFEILQSDWTAIFLQQNKSGYRAGTLPSVFVKVGLHPTKRTVANYDRQANLKHDLFLFPCSSTHGNTHSFKSQFAYYIAVEADAAYQGCLSSCELHSRLLAVGPYRCVGF